MGALKVDEFDLRLMAALHRNGRAAMRQLARPVGLSEGACRARAKRLEKAGLIDGYSAVLAFDRLGAFQAWADVTLIDDRAAEVARFESLALADPNIAGVWLTAGDAHFRLLVVTSGYDEWLAFSARMLGARDMVRTLKVAPIFKASRAGEAFPARVLSALVRRRTVAVHAN